MALAVTGAGGLCLLAALLLLGQITGSYDLDVILASGADAAESTDAVYTIASGEVVLTGNVLLTQGGSTISGQKLTVDLTTGTGRMDGRVRTVLQPSGN